MMAQSRAESTRDTYNYEQYINQFPPNTIKVIREFERIQKKICRHHHHHHHVVLVAQIFLTLSRHFSLSFIASGRSSGLHPVSSYSCWMYHSCWSSCFCSAMCGGPIEYITYEFFPTSPAMSCMSGSSNLSSFRDRRQVAIQLVYCGVLPPGLV